MPPRLPGLVSLGRKGTSVNSPLTAFILPFLQTRNASILGSLADNPGAYQHRIRVGRGPSSGKGKTSGRGHKGQKQRGKVPARFQGGQTPQEVVHGVRGFTNQFSVEMSPINLDRIQDWINQGRLDPTKPITLKELAKSRCLHGVKDGVKLLARGSEVFKTPVNLLVSRASTAAIEAVEAAGGKVTTRFYTKPAIKRLLKGESVSSPFPLALQESLSPTTEIPAHPTASPFSYRLPDPTSRKDMEYYRDSAKRGYLSHLVQEGHGPSLFFKTPGTGKFSAKKGKAAVGRKGENKVW